METCTAQTKRGTRCRNPQMPWFGFGPHPGVCARHADEGQTKASTARLDQPFNPSVANPAAPFPGVSITPRFLESEVSSGWVAKITGTHKKYVFARIFLDRSGPPYGWKLTGNGLYECRDIGTYGRFSCFFVVKGIFRKRIQFLTYEAALALAKRGAL